jgi:hypothetical protein
MTIIRLGSILWLLSTLLYANFEVKTNKTILQLGEPLVISFIGTGDSIKFDDISSILNYKILGTSSSTSMSIMNGNITKKVIRSYKIIPTKSFNLPSYKATIDGMQYSSKEIQIVVDSTLGGNQDKDFILKLSVDKNTSLVGEAIIMTLTFKRKLSIDIYDINPSGINFGSLTAKQISKEVKSRQGNYSIQEVKYLLIGSKEGLASIEPTFVDVSIQVKSKSFFGFTDQINKRVYSNALTLDIKKNPSSSSIVGDFDINATIKQNKINGDSVINLKLSVFGKGALEYLKKFNLDINETTIYKQKHKQKSFIKNGVLYSNFEQEFVILSDKSLVIPSFELEYFDTKTDKIKLIKTDKIAINIKQNKTKQNKTKLQIDGFEKIKDMKSGNKLNVSNIIIFIFGFFSGSLAIILIYIVLIKKEYYKLFFKSRDSNKKILLDMLPYVGKDFNIDEIALKLEENIYKNKNHKIDKKQVKEFYKKLVDKNKKGKK